MANFNKIFSSSFIQPWLVESWDYNRWTDELIMLQAVGIDEIIIQNITDTKNRYAIYPSKIDGYSCCKTDVIATALSAAICIGIKVRIGLGFSSLWWGMNTFSKSWLKTETAINKAIIKEIDQLYGLHPCFKGWYIPYEFSQLTAITKKQKLYLNNFYKDICSEIKLISNDDIMIAPFYNGKISLLCSLSSWRKMIIDILYETGIDILALQDSIGAGFNKMKDLDELYLYTKSAAEHLSIKLYADTETFAVKYSRFIPAEQKRIEEQIFIERKYVEKFVAFSISHYQNKNIILQKYNYNMYYDYYKTNK